MVERSRSLLFRKRNILGAALAGGIAVGIYLGQWSFLGGGGTGFWGLTNSGGTSPSTADSKKDSGQTGSTKPEVSPSDETEPTTIPKVVRVLIDDREYLLQGASGDSPISLTKLIDLIKKAPGDEDGIRVRIKEKSNMRMSMEEKLKDALTAAGIPDSAVLFVPSGSAK